MGVGGSEKTGISKRMSDTNGFKTDFKHVRTKGQGAIEPEKIA